MERDFIMNNGLEIPSVGLGTWQTPDGDTAINAVKCALSDGYRHIDAAAVYANEESVGRGIAESGIPRSQIFVTSKVWNTNRGYDATLRAFDKTSNDLGLDYLDLYLVHWPASPNQFPNWKEINRDTWRAMERLHKEGRVKSIGVSNFMPHHLEALILKAEFMPAVDQIEYHPGFMQPETVKYCKEHDILVEAWSPLGTGRLLDNATLQGIAERNGKSVAQICIRWCLQHHVLPLPKSITPARILQNIEVYDFEISPADMAIIEAMPYCGGSGLDPDKIDF
ncbi:MAG: aldo/keto reductase [Bacteroidales bacterium]|nr:aldo/keto reductase [Bacteroidales bacterium]